MTAPKEDCIFRSHILGRTDFPTEGCDLWPELKLRTKNGKSQKSEDPEEASTKFLKQEWPEIATIDETMNKPVFIPDGYFLSKNPELLDENYQQNTDSQSQSKMDKKFRDPKITQNFKSDYKGDLNERNAFERLKTLLNNEPKNAVLIHGWKNKCYVEHVTNTKPKEETEADFLIICPDYKTIINLEAKSSANKNKGTEATRQFEEHFKELSEILPMTKGWTFAKSVYFPKIEAKDCCFDCYKFVMTENSDIQEWWKACTGQAAAGCCSSAGNPSDFKDIMKRLVYFMHLHFEKAPLIKGQARDQTFNDFKGKVGSKANILLWTKEQYRAFYQKEKRVLLTSKTGCATYGTGKTILLTGKCLEGLDQAAEYRKMAKKLKKSNDKIWLITLAESLEEEKFYYIIYPSFSYIIDTSFSNTPCLFTYEKTVQFEEQSNIKVMDIQSIATELNINLFQQLKGRKEGTETRTYVFELILEFLCAHAKDASGFFLDEVEPSNFSFTNIGEKLKEYKGLLWVAFARCDLMLTDQKRQDARKKGIKTREEELTELRKKEAVDKAEFVIMELTKNMRNVDNVSKEAYPPADWLEIAESSPLKVPGRDPYSKLVSIGSNDDLYDVISEALDQLPNGKNGLPDHNDLLVVLPGRNYDGLLAMIEQYFSARKETPLYRCLPSRGIVSDNIKDFFRNGRKGVVVADQWAVPGTEFKSVLAFFPKNIFTGKRVEDNTIFTQSIILRCVCDLNLIEYPAPWCWIVLEAVANAYVFYIYKRE